MSASSPRLIRYERVPVSAVMKAVACLETSSGHALDVEAPTWLTLTGPSPGRPTCSDVPVLVYGVVKLLQPSVPLTRSASNCNVGDAPTTNARPGNDDSTHVVPLTFAVCAVALSAPAT